MVYKRNNNWSSTCLFMVDTGIQKNYRFWIGKKLNLQKGTKKIVLETANKQQIKTDKVINTLVSFATNQNQFNDSFFRNEKNWATYIILGT